MAISHLYTITCDYLVMGTDGKPSAVGMFRNIHVDDFPATKDPLGVLVALVGEEGSPVTVTLEDPKGETLITMANETIEPPHGLAEHQQWHFQVVGVASPAYFSQPGVYRIVVRSEEQEIHSYTFGVYSKEVQQESDG